ncbi:MAG: hypothetical protein IPH78_08830 [Bacteroidetes bacterium]|nr:hypothetical protein [Bacteroidota bacterium]
MLEAIFPSADSRVLLALPVLLAAPSVLLWSSGVVKEPLLVLSLGVYVYAFHISVECQTGATTVCRCTANSCGEVLYVGCLLPATRGIPVEQKCKYFKQHGRKSM